LRVLIACEISGVVRDAFLKKGHDAWSCDLFPSDSLGGGHLIQSCLEVMYQGWDMMIAFPPCTHLACSGAAHFEKKIKLGKQQAALDFIRLLMAAPIEKICIENPVGVISSKIRKPNQIIQPWQFGDPFQKSTCLWLKNLPLLKPTKIVDKGEFYISPKGKKMPLWFSKNKSAKIRSKTFQGIADGMSDQWNFK
jgi:site-specific DNA-cytosine methylase